LNKVFARCFVISCSVSITIADPISFEHSAEREAPGLAPRLVKGEEK
jgi:hypothetical protein